MNDFCKGPSSTEFVMSAGALGAPLGNLLFAAASRSAKPKYAPSIGDKRLVRDVFLGNSEFRQIQ